MRELKMQLTLKNDDRGEEKGKFMGGMSCVGRF